MLWKKTIPVVIAFVCGLWFAIADYIPTDFAEQTTTWASNWYKILVGFAAVLGLYSLCHLHWSKIRRGVPGWGYSLLVYVGLLATVFVGLIGEFQKALQVTIDKLNVMTGTTFTFANFQSYDVSEYTFSSGFMWIEKWVFTPSSATMFSLLGFFIASAAYRTFRARTWQAGFLLIAAVIVMFGQVPLSAAISEWFPWAADWIMANPNMAAKRGIMLGVSLGTVATALRIIFGIERAYLGGE